MYVQFVLACNCKWKLGISWSSSSADMRLEIFSNNLSVYELGEVILGQADDNMKILVNCADRFLPVTL